MLKRAVPTLSALATLLLAPVALAGDPPEVPWALTGTSSTALEDPAPTHRVEHRRFPKASRFLLRAGFSYLSRGDFYVNPGVTAEATWYPAEVVGIDLSTTTFFSSLSSTAVALRKSTGLLPDSQRPRLRLVTGARLAFAYGKVLVEELDTVVHLDASFTAHAGVLITHDAVNFAGDAGLAVQAAALDHLIVWLEVSWLGSYEARTTTSFAGGIMGTVGAGLIW